MKKNKLFNINKKFVLLFSIGVSQCYSILAQCPNCKAAVESNLDSKKDMVGLGLNDGILYLMVMPYLAAVIIGYLWYKNRKQQLNNAAGLS